METTSATEQPLTLKKLEGHIIKTIIGALIVAFIASVGSHYAFYYKATDDIQDLKNNKVEMKDDIKELKSAVSDIKMAISNTGIYTNENKDKINSLEQDVKDIKLQQAEMLKVLYEIKAKQGIR